MTLHPTTLQSIQDTAVKAAGARIVKIDGEPRKVLIESNGQYKEYDLPPPILKATVLEIDDLIRLAIADGVPQPRSVWHHYESIVLVLDDEDRRDTVTMPLPKTELFQWVERCAKAPDRLDQRAFLLLLKRELEYVVTPEQMLDFVAVLQAIKFRRSDQTEADLSKRGTEGLGRQIEKECTGADKLPEYLTVQVPVYRNAPEVPPAEINIFVTIDFDKEQFVLSPSPDRVAQSLDGAQMILGDMLRQRIEKDAPKDGQKISVYFGKP